MLAILFEKTKIWCAPIGSAASPIRVYVVMRDQVPRCIRHITFFVDHDPGHLFKFPIALAVGTVKAKPRCFSFLVLPRNVMQ